MIWLINYLGDILLVNASETTGVRRIELTSLYPKVCPSNQSESDPIRSLKNQSDRIQSETNISDPIRLEAKKSQSVPIWTHIVYQIIS